MGRFPTMHDALFARRGRLDPAQIGECAREVGFDLDRVADPRRRVAAKLDADRALAQRIGVAGVPVLFLVRSDGAAFRLGTAVQVDALLAAPVRYRQL